MGLDSHITLAVVFSFLAMIGNLVGIYATFHARSTENTKKEVANAEEFVKVNFKLDQTCQRLAAIDKNTDKTTEIVGKIQTELVDIKHTLTDHEKILIEHENRLDRLEEKHNG